MTILITQNYALFVIIITIMHCLLLLLLVSLLFLLLLNEVILFCDNNRCVNLHMISTLLLH